MNLIQIKMENNKRGSSEKDDIITRSRKRSVKSIPILYKNVDGTEKRIEPKETFWYLKYIANPILHEKDKILFRRRFRLPPSSYLELLREVKSCNLFRRWISKDCVNKNSSPIELLLLGSLRYLGRGWTFDDLEEQTGISKENHRQFFHVFIKFGSTNLFQKYVKAPSLAIDAQTHGNEYNMAGLHGAIGSTDATHISIEKVPVWLNHVHKIHKLNSSSRTYNITTNHRRYILSTTSDHPESYNDKTLLLFDDFLTSLQKGTILQDYEFELFDVDSNGNFITKKYRGPWVIADNGYSKFQNGQQ